MNVGPRKTIGAVWAPNAVWRPNLSPGDSSREFNSRSLVYKILNCAVTTDRTSGRLISGSSCVAALLHVDVGVAAILAARDSRSRGLVLTARTTIVMRTKNYSVVRQTVGYQRFDTAAELMVLKQLYAALRLYTNFFQPTMKLQSKERFGSRVKKSYHAPQTPYQRLLACAEVTTADKKKLQRQYQELNPAALKRKLDKQRKELFRLAAHKRPVRPKRYANQIDLKINPPLMI
jgi:hypothetical protein